MQHTYFFKEQLMLRGSTKGCSKFRHLNLLKAAYKLLNYLIPSERLQKISLRKKTRRNHGIGAKQQLTPHSFNFAQ